MLFSFLEITAQEVTGLNPVEAHKKLCTICKVFLFTFME